MIGPGREALSLFSQGWFATNLIFLVSIGSIAPYFVRLVGEWMALLHPP